MNSQRSINWDRLHRGHTRLIVFLVLFPFSLLLSQDTTLSARTDKKPELRATKLRGGINTDLNEFGIHLSADGNSMYYYSKRRNSNYTDLYKSSRQGQEWTRGEELDEINSQFDDQSPFVLDSEDRILFSSNRDGSFEFKLGSGKIGVSRDLYLSKKTEQGWSISTRLPLTINTPEIEENPYLVGNRLYFTRYPFGNVGESDIFASDYVQGNWGRAFRLPDPINTDYVEIAATFSKDGKSIYFSSNRPGGFGGLDIYKSIIQPNGSFSKPINLGKEINSPGDEAFFLETNEGKVGFFCRRTEKGTDYDIYEIGLENDWEELRSGKKISLESIHFKTASYEIEAESHLILDRLVQFLKENTRAKLKITGHTDLNGNPEDNLVLSRQRAESVKNFLTSKGISSQRIQTDGKGILEPVVPEKNPETDYKNRRTEFQLVE
ncbi:hypothetical protein CH373_00775 [Leptospira perolatii]|uniref:OmpA-like domain-containing protein n=1 Tax=Leptospira perolatii TaxID=2023191 RepID=A0A2M9ZRD6_9LEPT|nr:OmpA family protein [Leptospira perolatii]PJZ71090.1 hypothetical protein CH360_00775 [Leptospira perolatii]PJZ74622.1 hypothetical protein CH373_00775 [Leptospira perolatii]